MIASGTPARGLVIRFRKGLTALSLIAAGGERLAEPRLVLGKPSAGNIPLSWSSVPGRLYRVQTSNSLQTRSQLPAAVETAS